MVGWGKRFVDSAESYPVHHKMNGSVLLQTEVRLMPNVRLESIHLTILSCDIMNPLRYIKTLERHSNAFTFDVCLYVQVELIF
jgi:hypothetical protein